MKACEPLIMLALTWSLGSTTYAATWDHQLYSLLVLLSGVLSLICDDKAISWEGEENAACVEVTTTHFNSPIFHKVPVLP